MDKSSNLAKGFSDPLFLVFGSSPGLQDPPGMHSLSAKRPATRFKQHLNPRQVIQRLQTALFQEQIMCKMGAILFCFTETRDIPKSEAFKTFISINHCRLNKTQKLHFREKKYY